MAVAALLDERIALLGRWIPGTKTMPETRADTERRVRPGRRGAAGAAISRCACPGVGGMTRCPPQLKGGRRVAGGLSALTMGASRWACSSGDEHLHRVGATASPGLRLGQLWWG